MRLTKAIMMSNTWRWLWDSRHWIPKNNRPHLMKLTKAIMMSNTWRWLWDSRHWIPKNTRPHLMKLTMAIMMASTLDELEQRPANLQKDETATLFALFIHYSENLLKRKEEWALSYRIDMIVRANNTNNYAEAGMRIVKENIFIGHPRKSGYPTLSEWAEEYQIYIRQRAIPEEEQALTLLDQLAGSAREEGVCHTLSCCWPRQAQRRWISTTNLPSTWLPARTAKTTNM